MLSYTKRTRCKGGEESVKKVGIVQARKPVTVLSARLQLVSKNLGKKCAQCDNYGA